MAKRNYDGVKWEREINVIRGKVSVERQTQRDVELLIEYITRIEAALDEADDDDALGPSGWRHQCSVE